MTRLRPLAVPLLAVLLGFLVLTLFPVLGGRTGSTIAQGILDAMVRFFWVPLVLVFAAAALWRLPNYRWLGQVLLAIGGTWIGIILVAILIVYLTFRLY